MDDAGAGVVDGAVAEAEAIAELREPAAAPHPSAEDRIDEGADQHRENTEALEVPSLGTRAGDDGRRRVHEDHHEQEQHDHAGVIRAAREEEAGGADQAPAVIAAYR